MGISCKVCSNENRWKPQAHNKVIDFPIIMLRHNLPGKSHKSFILFTSAPPFFFIHRRVSEHTMRQHFTPCINIIIPECTPVDPKHSVACVKTLDKFLTRVSRNEGCCCCRCCATLLLTYFWLSRESRSQQQTPQRCCKAHQYQFSVESIIFKLKTS